MPEEPTTARASDDWLVPVLRELISVERVRELARAACDSGGSYWRAAVSAGMTTDDAILAAVARRTRMRVATVLTTTPLASARVPELLARRYGVLPLTLSESALEIATGNPYDLDCEQTLAFVAGRRVRMSLASPMRIAERLDEVYRPASVIERILAAAPTAALEQVVAVTDHEVQPDELASGARERPIIQLVDHIVAQGIEARASDIHLESEEDTIAVRYRVDGVLRRTLSLPRSVGIPLVSRVKIMAGMDIADRLRPQGGRALVTVHGERVDLRVSTLPAAHGEKVVIRVLDPRASVREVEELGLAPSDASELRRLLAVREGLILVTGPTGSGKTTTLYAALRQLLGRGLNIVTVEDPVEYRLAGTVQVQVNERAGLTFAAALRSILRQDPDVILVGEIRDAETAQIAIQAALTGHLVFATLHTIDAASSVTRLHDLGIDPAKVAAALKGVIAQRLVRRSCAACAAPSSDPIPSSLWTVVPSGAQLRRGRGCESCAGTGYRGRIAVVELVVVAPAVTRLVAAGVPAEALRAAMRAAGSRSLWAAGVAHVLDGSTTADEVERVLEPDGSIELDRADGAEYDDADPSDVDAYSLHAAVADHAVVREPIPSRSISRVLPHEAPRTASLAIAAAAMTRMKVGVVDVYVMDPSASPWRALALKRGTGTRCPGAWEAVHGHIEDDETPEDAAIREVREETGLAIERLYNVTVHAFYLHQTGTVEMAVVFCAFARSDAPVTLGTEHVAYEWLPLDRAAERYLWPRATQAIGEIRKLLGGGDAGPAEDVLRVR